MPNTAAIIKEHRAAAGEQRKRLRKPAAARRFLVRAGILAKDGKRLAARYR